MIWKSDSCLNIEERREESLTLAMTCVKIFKSTQTILVAFNTSLYINSPQQSIELFLSLLQCILFIFFHYLFYFIYLFILFILY